MIGIIDSGFGGLSVVAELIKQDKNCPFIYLGDSKNIPYGEKTKAEIVTLSLRLVEYLVTEHNIDTLVIACNTIVSAAFDEIKTAYPTLLIENIVAHGAVSSLQSFNEHVTVVATKMTVTSNIYPRYITEISDTIIVQQLMASNWVTMVEQQVLDKAEVAKIVAQIDKETDVLILGCTHFPFLYQAIRELLPQHVQIVDPAYSCVQELPQRQANDSEPSLFLTTGSSAVFSFFLKEHDLYDEKIKVKTLNI